MFNIFSKQKGPATPKELLRKIEVLEDRLEELEKAFSLFRKDMARVITKVGIVRFNPFNDIGGDQSFSIALLDEEKNGLVLTSHYARGSNRLYAKPIQNGKSSYSLSTEEEEAIDQAITQSAKLK